MVRQHAEDESDEKLLADVQRHGWHLVGIDDDSNCPAYVFSVGIFHTLGQPEICIIGLSSTDAMAQIVNVIGEEMRAGMQFEDWQESNDVLEGYSCVFRKVDRSFNREYFGYARWFYEGDEFPMLQCVWPDKSNRFPWDSDFNPQLVQSQPVLANESAWPFLDAKNLGVFTTSLVLDDGYPIVRVIHEDDGDWQFLCDETNVSDEGRLVSLLFVVENHPSVAELADLPRGWEAWRDGPGEPWIRAEL